MHLFRAENATKSHRHRATFAAFEIAHTLADFGAAIMFIIGSIMFFFDAWQTMGTWLFLIGSILFACKPSLRLARELRLVAMGDVEDYADTPNG
jgi:uncharacterized membrane protein YgdD (TMEM256/DUF423 family)